MLPYIFLALSTLGSEDLTCIAAGALVGRGELPFAAAAAACAFGIFAGDLLLVLAGRSARFPRLRRRASALTFLDRHAGWKLAATRFTPGLRLPTYVAAGLRGLPMARVVPPLLAGAAVWTPILVGVAAVARAALVMSGLRALEWGVVAAVVVKLAVGCRIWSWRTRRRAYAVLCRIARWEFWPSWAAYLPLLPYLLWLAIKRGLTVFTAANPGIPTGGLVGESKSAILKQLSRESDLVALCELIAPDLGALRAFMAREGLSFPVVLKPDLGERGSGVAIVRSEDEAERYVGAAGVGVIAQEYVAGPEYGVLYSSGRVVSITEKRLPEVVGDGVRSLEELIMANPRAFMLESRYRRAARRPMSDVPALGERIKLVEIGSHSMGAVFLDATHLWTPALEQAVKRLSEAHDGFHYGRFDVRASSVEEFQNGHFKALELNGVGAEPTHIYDPAINIFEAYRTLARHWRTMFAIGAENVRRGARPASVGEIRRALRSR